MKSQPTRRNELFGNLRRRLSKWLPAVLCCVLLSGGWWGLRTTHATATSAAALACTTNPVVMNGNDSGAGSLRQAIIDACPGSTITFSVSGTITLASTLPPINNDLTIDGTGRSIIVSGNNSVQVMIVNSGKALTLLNLTIANGKCGCRGGGIVNFGTLTVTNSTFSGNSVGNGDGGADGGGIENDGGTVNVTNSTFTGNSAYGGGGIENRAGTLNVINSTFSDNSARLGGGIYNRSTANVTNSTFSGNSLADLNFTGGGILNDSTLNFANTIIANSSRGVDCANLGTIGTNKNNLVMDGSCSPALSGDPKLGPLQNNGGPTQTMALLPGSPAIDLGDNCVVQNPGCLSTPLTTDQRGAGFPRKVGSVVDIGAFEVGSCVTNPIVTTTADSGAGSLRQAIADACPGSAITFNLPANSTITLTSGELVLDKNLTIQGPGANLLTISGNNASRVFDIPTDVTATLSGLTITNGNAVGSGGGGICNQGTLTVRECLVSNSSADNHGGGILNTNLLTVVNSTIANNQDTADIGGIDSHGTATISNSTITGNSGSGIAGESGAILLTVTNCTITNNAAGGFGGGIFKNSGIGNIKGTIVAGNTAGLGDPDAFGSYVSQGFNLIGQNDSSTGFTNGVNNDQVGTSANPLPALLAPLGNYGGPTQTHALLPGSPAINAGTSSGAPATDQRGINRVGNVDIGAFESRGFMLAIMSGNNQTAAPTAPFANPLAVAVSSNFNEPVQGGQVSFTPPGSGPSAVLSNSAVTLPANGQASVMATANALSGAYQVTAGGAGMNQVAFALNNFCVSNPVVTNLNDSGPGSLRQAIADACVGSTITFNLPANSTITLTSGELVINKHLTIQGPGANLLTVSGNNQSRVFQIVEAPLNVTLSGLTIAAGYHKTPDVVSAASFVAAERAYGGGLYDQSSGTVNLTDCVLTGNRTQGGNATGSNSESVVSGEGFGGAIAQRGNGVLNINGCRFTNNYAFTGTASGGSNNFAFPSQGGAINCDGTLNLSQCTLSGNSALRGGAIYQTGSMTLAASSIYNNEARDSGGGVDDEGTASTIINTTISGNRAVFDGGGIRSRSRNRTITNCTITDNHVDGQLGFGGGGLFGNINPPLQLKNTIIAGNTAPASPDLQDLVTSLGNNLIGDGTGANGLTNGVNGDQVGTPAAPLDAKLGPLANNGGPTLTHRLLPGSPAINAGTSSDAPATDQRGVARPQNGALDIGAVESNYVLAATSGTPQTTIPGTPFAAPLLATLTENGLPLANVPLTFSAPGSGASATFPGGATVNTNAQGQASASAVANLVPGSYAVQAAATGLPPASFALTNACPTITLAALPQATAGVLFNAALSASPAGGNYQFSSANLPGWLTLGGNGSLSGTPPAAGTFTFNVSVTGFGQCQQNFSVRLTVVCPAITLTPVNLPAATINTAYPTTLSASPAGAFSFALTGGLLPAGLTLNSNGTFSGAPTQSGVFNFRVTATAFGACSGFRDYVLLVECPGVTLSPASLPGGTVGTAYNQTVSASPAGSYSYNVSSGALPPGLTLNAATGVISGTPITNGTFNFRVAATSGSCSGARDYTVTMACAGVTITTTTLPAGTAGNAYAQTISVTSVGSYSFALVTGNLPSGLTLNATTGVLSGLPTVTGSYSFTLRATAANGCVATQSYTLVVGCPSVTLAALPTPTLNAAYSQTVTATPAGGNYAYAVSGGGLPAGLVLNAATGVISGTPTVAGAYSFTLTATGFGACTGSRVYSGTIAGSSCPAITLSALPNGQPGRLYNQTVAATPSGSYSYAVTAGALPAGLTLYGAAGLLFGYPAVTGTYNFTLTATDANNCTGTRAYTLNISNALAALAMQADYDGDGKADPALWSASDGMWRISQSSTQQTVQQSWGTAGDVTLLGDYDGDGKSDLAVFRPSDATFYVKRSSDSGFLIRQWGLSTDVPVPGDYDGDGKTDIAIWRPSEGNWYVCRSSDGNIDVTNWGAGTAPYNDVAVPGDYDGDGKSDLAVFRRASGTWLVKRSSDSKFIVRQWGVGADVPVAADYDGDGVTDCAVWRQGTWYIWQSASNRYRLENWGTSAAPYYDQALPGDYDGDGLADLAVWRLATQTWYVKGSEQGVVITKNDGLAEARPVGLR